MVIYSCSNFFNPCEEYVCKRGYIWKLLWMGQQFVVKPESPKKTVVITIPVDMTVYPIFGARSPGYVHYFDCFLCVWCVPITKWRRNSSILRLNTVQKNWSEMVSRLRFPSGVSGRGTDPFFRSILFPFSIPRVSTIRLAFWQ